MVVLSFVCLLVLSIKKGKDLSPSCMCIYTCLGEFICTRICADQRPEGWIPSLEVNCLTWVLEMELGSFTSAASALSWGLNHLSGPTLSCEARSHITQASLESFLLQRMPLNFSCLYLLSARVIDMHHHVPATLFSLDPSQLYTEFQASLGYMRTCLNKTKSEQ